MEMTWSERYATGFREIDEQHQRLFALLNDLERRLSESRPPETMRDVLDELARYAMDHFAFEEACMARCRCPNASVNKLAHQRLVRLIEQTIRDMRLAPPTRETFESIHRELVDWLKGHICKIDIKLREFAAAAR